MRLKQVAILGLCMAVTGSSVYLPLAAHSSTIDRSERSERVLTTGPIAEVAYSIPMQPNHTALQEYLSKVQPTKPKKAKKPHFLVRLFKKIFPFAYQLAHNSTPQKPMLAKADTIQSPVDPKATDTIDIPVETPVESKVPTASPDTKSTASSELSEPTTTEPPQVETAPEILTASTSESPVVEETPVEETPDNHPLQPAPADPNLNLDQAMQLKMQETEYLQEAINMAVLGLDELQETESKQNTQAKQNLAFVQNLETTPRATSSKSQVSILRSGVSANVNSVELTLNKATVLHLSKPAARISISDPTIASAVIISPTQIQLVGEEVGVANLLVWSNPNSPEHTIVDISVHRDVSVLTKQLTYVDPGIKIVPLAAEDTVILVGEAESRESAQLAVDLAKAFFGAEAGAAAAGTAQSSSQSAGSSLPGSSSNIINLIKVKGEPSTKLQMVRNRLANIDPNIHLDIVPGPDGSEKAMLYGKVRSAGVVSKAINTASIFYGQPGIKVITGPGGNLVRDTGSASGFQGSNGFNNNMTANVLQGSVITDATGNVISMLEVAQRPQVKCRIQFLEISKNDLDALGHVLMGQDGGRLGFAHRSGVQSAAPGKPIGASVAADSGAAFSSSSSRAGLSSLGFATGFSDTFLSGVTQVFSINEQIAAAISALQENNKTRTLAEPTLTMLSGEKGSFLAGGEVPIPVVGNNGQMSVDYHEFGIRLNLIPTVTDSGKIHMQVAPEISNIDQANGVTTTAGIIPGFSTRRLQTTLELNDGQSFVLAGLFNQKDISSTSGFPVLGKLPIIGSFFRNKWNSGQNTEMVVIIKPEVMMSTDEVPSVASEPRQ